jgi:hypothetical protein
MTIQELETIVKKHMLLADEGIVRLICAFIISARLLKTAPPWIFIVGASSGGKSMLLKSLEKISGIKPLDDLTSNTFASGMKKKPGDKSNSLLDKVNPGDILTFKDFTTILGKEKEQRSTIISQLRKIYDGDFMKTYGNGTEMKWKGRLSVLSGVTSSVYSVMSQFQDMGERFLMYVFEQPNRDEMAILSTLPRDNPAIDEEMQNAFKQCVDSIKVPTEVPKLDEDTRKEIAELSEFATRVRSRVERNEYSREKEIKQPHFLEMPGRFTTQIMSMAYGLCALNDDGKLTERDKKILYKLALDSITNMKRVCLQELTKFTWAETAALAVKMRLPVTSIRIPLQDLASLEVIEWKKGKGNRDKWSITDKYRRIMAKYDSIEMSADMLIAENEDDDAYLAAEAMDAPMPMDEPEFLRKEIDPAAARAAEIMGGEVLL